MFYTPVWKIGRKTVCGKTAAPPTHFEEKKYLLSGLLWVLITGCTQVLQTTMAKKKKSEKKTDSSPDTGTGKSRTIAPKNSTAKSVSSRSSKVKRPTQTRKTPSPARPTSDEIRLRAYFIAERREKMGWPGNSEGDWVEAERQLLAEARKIPPSRPSSKAS